MISLDGTRDPGVVVQGQCYGGREGEADCEQRFCVSEILPIQPSGSLLGGEDRHASESPGPAGTFLKTGRYEKLVIRKQKTFLYIIDKYAEAPGEGPATQNFQPFTKEHN